jgi:hypothetical protein
MNHNTRNSLKGKLKDFDNDKMYSGLDACKSYGNLLHNMEYIPILSSFDDFMSYTGGIVNPYYFYIVRKIDDFQGADLIFDSNEIMTSGTTVIYLQEKVKIKFEILAELKACKLIENPLYGKVKGIFENTNYNVYLKKFLINSIIGLLGKKQNTFKKMILSTDKEYILNICKSYGEIGINSYPMEINEDVVEECEEVNPLYAFYAETKSKLTNGFYPIQLMIYDMQRITLFKSFKEVSIFTKPIAVNTDCVYFEKCELLEKYIADKYNASFGSKKLEKPKYLQCILELNVREKVKLMRL